MTKPCPNCGTPNRDDARFCFNCATPLVNEILCPSCGTANQPQARFCHYCAMALRGTTPQTGMLQPNAALAGRYIIMRKVGGGGMGAVYQATDQRIQGKLWAIKEMSDAAITNPLDRQQAVDAFQREAQLLATLDHGNLPKVSDYFTEGGKYYLVMDFIRGRTLEEVLDSTSGFLTEDAVVGWALQLCDVLAYLHSRRPPVIFRDLKPGNIMLDAEGRVRLIDFGIARLFRPGKGKDTQVMGTPGYAAPEQYGTGQTDGRSDIYALGVTLHRLLTGYDPSLTPFNLPPARNINPGLSPAVEAVIAKATQADVTTRYQTAKEMRQALLAPTGPLRITAADAKRVELLHTLEGHTACVESVAFSPDGLLLASGSHDKTVQLWRVADGSQVRILKKHTDGVNSVAFSPDGSLLVSGADDKTVRLWRVADGSLLHTLKGHTGWVWSVAFSPDGSLLASGSDDKIVRLWRVADGSQVRILKGHTDSVISVAFSPDGLLLVSGSWDETVRLWHVANGSQVDVLKEHADSVIDVAFSPDGSLLASGSSDNTVRLWRVAGGSQARTLKGHADSVIDVAFSPDGLLLASASDDNTVRLWRVADGSQARTLKGHTDGVISVAFSPDGLLLASASDDNTVRMWGIK